MTDLIIYPKRGFLNTTFKIKSPKEDSYKVIFKDQTVSEGKIKAGATIALPKFATAGFYTIESSITKERHQVCVEDAIRLGSSDLKKSYVFDNFPYIIFVMKDRIHFYDPIIDTYVYTENFLSPNNIQAIAETKLLFFTEHSNGVSVSVFDTNGFDISTGKEYKKLIAFSKDGSTLYALTVESDSIVVVNTSDLSIIEEIELSANSKRPCYTIDEEKRLLYIVGKTSIHCIYIDTTHEKVLNIDNAIGITDNGYLIRYIAENRYEFENLCPNSTASRTFRYEVLGIRHFKGLSIENEEWQNESSACIDNIVSEYKAECERKIAAGKKVEVLKDLDLTETTTDVEFYPTSMGVYVVEKTNKRDVQFLQYYTDSKHVYGVTNDISKRLSWVANNGYKTSHKCDQWDHDTYVNGHLAFLALSSKEYVVIYNGKITAKFDTKSVAKDKVLPKQKTLAETQIVINGEEISPYNIASKSDNKLICRSGNSFEFYERDNIRREWGNPKIVELEEEQHACAKMSLDGKYIVYSKGGNEYALYNIKKQTEETILTGNFIDFDKSGNLLFEDSARMSTCHRELRIYDPVTFEWRKGTPELYKFVSPDGKLYAKTNIKKRYYNLLHNKEIDCREFNDITASVDRNFCIKCSDTEVEEIRKKRHEIVSNNKDYFHSYRAKHNYKECWIENIQDPQKCGDFSRFFLETKQYAVIGIVKSNKEIEIELGHQLSFLNYISFSYDNKYVGIVGKPVFNGYLKLSKIDFNEYKNVIKLEKDICDMQIANKATWTCAFTRQGLFGTYDSNPNLYLIEQSKFDSFTDENVNDFSFLKEHFMIPDRSLLCFSHSGKYMALSNQGYEAKSLGGCGHVPSNEVFIYDASSKEILASWHDQGDSIVFRNVANAGFSIDDSKLMTVSRDGVIVVRNIQEVLTQVQRPLSKAS